MGVAVAMCKNRYQPSVLATFLIAVPDKKQINVKEFILAYGCRGILVHSSERGKCGRGSVKRPLVTDARK